MSLCKVTNTLVGVFQSFLITRLTKLPDQPDQFKNALKPPLGPPKAASNTLQGSSSDGLGFRVQGSLNPKQLKAERP